MLFFIKDTLTNELSSAYYLLRLAHTVREEKKEDKRIAHINRTTSICAHYYCPQGRWSTSNASEEQGRLRLLKKSLQYGIRHTAHGH